MFVYSHLVCAQVDAFILIHPQLYGQLSISQLSLSNLSSFFWHPKSFGVLNMKRGVLTWNIKWLDVFFVLPILYCEGSCDLCTKWRRSLANLFVFVLCNEKIEWPQSSLIFKQSPSPTLWLRRHWRGGYLVSILSFAFLISLSLSHFSFSLSL